MARGPSTSRRAVLAAAATGLAAGAGCAGGVVGADEPPVTLLAAGSLYNAFENGLGPTSDAAVEIEAHGSAEVARLVADGVKQPDIVSVADTALFDGPLHPEWYAEFATNSLVLAYDGDTEAGERLASAGSERWYEPLLEDELSLGRTDPDLDPLGYRTLFALELATDHYGLDTDLRAAIPRRKQLFPETQLVSQFETGAIDAAFTYRNMAIERGYDYVDLPAEIDLGDPDHADAYATASYELPSGKVVEGGPISYGSTVRRPSPAVFDVFEEQLRGSYLADFGFGVPEDYPRFTGDVPAALR
jgi:molybdate/tungstate transport system substrate-binding protein